MGKIPAGFGETLAHPWSSQREGDEPVRPSLPGLGCCACQCRMGTEVAGLFPRFPGPGLCPSMWQWLSALRGISPAVNRVAQLSDCLGS